MAWSPPWASAAARWSCSTSEPLTLRAWLSAPLAWDPYNGVNCEGALQWTVVALASGMDPQEAFADAPCDELTPIPIPIADQDMAGWPIALASWAQPAPGSTETVRMRRKRASAESYGLHNVNTGHGEYKSEQVPIPTLTAAWVDFRVVGNRALLTELLPDVVTIGRHHSSGLGVVMGWEILPDPEQRSLLDHGRLMRTLPSGADVHPRPGTFAVRKATTRAPYWHRASLTESMVPIVRVAT